MVWEFLGPSWDRIGSQKGAKWGSTRLGNRVSRELTLKMPKPHNLNTVCRFWRIFRFCGFFLKPNLLQYLVLELLEAPSSNWRLPEVSQRHLGALLDNSGKASGVTKGGSGAPKTLPTWLPRAPKSFPDAAPSLQDAPKSTQSASKGTPGAAHRGPQRSVTAFREDVCGARSGKRHDHQTVFRTKPVYPHGQHHKGNALLSRYDQYGVGRQINRYIHQ